MTVKVFTNNAYNELKYDSTSEISGSFIKELVKYLGMAGIDTTSIRKTTSYDLNMVSAIKSYQIKNHLNVTGIVTDDLLEDIIQTALLGSSDIVEEDESYAENPSEEDYNSHYDSFFSENNVKTSRINGQDIVISFGDNSVVKTIKGVYVRSLGVEIDTSGNPISETYEFIAKDLVESDEPMDALRNENDTSQQLTPTHVFDFAVL